MRASRAVTVTLGCLHEHIAARVASGDYASVSEVVPAGLRALDREEAALDAVLRQKVQEALADLRPALPAAEVFATLRAHHARRMRDGERDAEGRVPPARAGRPYLSLQLNRDHIRPFTRG